MTIEERVAHLSNLTMLLNFDEKLGAETNPLLLKEYNLHHKDLSTALEEKHSGEPKEEGNE